MRERQYNWTKCIKIYLTNIKFKYSFLKVLLRCLNESISNVKPTMISQCKNLVDDSFCIRPFNMPERPLWVLFYFSFVFTRGRVGVGGWWVVVVGGAKTTSEGALIKQFNPWNWLFPKNWGAPSFYLTPNPIPPHTRYPTIQVNQELFLPRIFLM